MRNDRLVGRGLGSDWPRGPCLCMVITVGLCVRDFTLLVPVSTLEYTAVSRKVVLQTR